MKTLAFWHTFGPCKDLHGTETPEQIITRKRQEIAKNKWTLWSFQHRTLMTMISWIDEIHRLKPDRVLVLCSESKDAKIPQGKPKLAKHYREYQGDELQIPSKIKIPHSWKKNGLASAFKVSKILFPQPKTFDILKLNCLHIQHVILQPTCDFRVWKDEKWQECRLPARPNENLLKLLEAENTNGLRPIRAVLELQEPYVVEISCCK